MVPRADARPRHEHENRTRDHPADAARRGAKRAAEAGGERVPRDRHGEDRTEGGAHAALELPDAQRAWGGALGLVSV